MDVWLHPTSGGMTKGHPYIPGSRKVSLLRTSYISNCLWTRRTIYLPLPASDLAFLPDINLGPSYQHLEQTLSSDLLSHTHQNLSITPLLVVIYDTETRGMLDVMTWWTPLESAGPSMGFYRYVRYLSLWMPNCNGSQGIVLIHLDSISVSTLHTWESILFIILLFSESPWTVSTGMR